MKNDVLFVFPSIFVQNLSKSCYLLRKLFMKELEQYARDCYPKELDIVSSQMSSKHLPILTNEEKTLIYKYTDDGYHRRRNLRIWLQ